MRNLHRKTNVLRFCTGRYPDWFLKNPNRTQEISRSHPGNHQGSLCLSSILPGTEYRLRRIFKDIMVQIIFKGCNMLKTLLTHHKDKIWIQLNQGMVYQWTCPEENCSSSYIGESSRCLESRVKNTIPHLLAQYSNIV